MRQEVGGGASSFVLFFGHTLPLSNSPLWVHSRSLSQSHSRPLVCRHTHAVGLALSENTQETGGCVHPPNGKTNTHTRLHADGQTATRSRQADRADQRRTRKDLARALSRRKNDLPGPLGRVPRPRVRRALHILHALPQPLVVHQLGAQAGSGLDEVAQDAQGGLAERLGG